jgi:CSLREA domain-containing protein
MFAALALILLGLGLSSRPVGAAADIYVDTTADEINTDGDCSLREAVQAANTDTAVDACTAGSGADVIHLPAGTYTLTITGAGESANLTGDLNVFTDDLTLTGAGSATTTITGGTGWDDRLLMLSGAVDLDLSGVTFSGGDCPFSGGGIFHNGAILTMTDVVLTGNQGQSGGGLYTGDGRTTEMTDVQISGNSCTAINCNGGGIHNRGGLTMTESVIEGNTAGGYGGGLYQFQGSASLTRVTLYDNRADNGGGIATSGALTVEESLLDRNHADQVANGNGGGVYISYSGVIIRNVTLSGNTANGSGAGIYQSFSTGVTLNNVTITGNNAGLNTIYAIRGGGIYLVESQMTLYNSIIAGNLHDGTAEISGVDCDSFNSTVFSGGYNLEGVGREAPDTCEFTGLGDQQGTALGPIDPRLGPLGDHGGPTHTHMLLPGSPAIDAGNPATPGSGGVACMATDQRGVARPLGNACDIGAYEGAFLYLPLITR